MWFFIFPTLFPKQTKKSPRTSSPFHGGGYSFARGSFFLLKKIAIAFHLGLPDCETRLTWTLMYVGVGSFVVLPAQWLLGDRVGNTAPRLLVSLSRYYWVLLGNPPPELGTNPTSFGWADFCKYFSRPSRQISCKHDQSASAHDAGIARMRLLIYYVKTTYSPLQLERFNMRCRISWDAIRLASLGDFQSGFGWAAEMAWKINLQKKENGIEKCLSLSVCHDHYCMPLPPSFQSPNLKWKKSSN